MFRHRPLPTVEETASPLSGFVPLYYLRLGFNIARWDELAIRRASRDAHALFYALVLWAASVLIIFLRTAIPAFERLHAQPQL